MASRKISEKGLNLIKQFEGCRLRAYQCSAGVWTIGYGHTSGVRQGQSITQAQAEEYLKQDCRKFENYVNNKAYVSVTEELNQNQYDALVSFAFNCGQGNLKTLCKGRTTAQIATAIPKYNKAAGKVIAGLVKRRTAEQKLFNTKVEEKADTGSSGTCEYKAGVWYETLEEIPARNGYYGQPGKYEYLSATLKKSCVERKGIGYLRKGCIIKPVEVKQFSDGSIWFMLDKTISCLAVGTGGEKYIKKV